jgi:hypothetical protein
MLVSVYCQWMCTNSVNAALTLRQIFGLVKEKGLGKPIPLLSFPS